MNKVEREMSEQEPRENKKTSRGEPHLLRLTSRDKEPIAHVAVARYLTAEQVRRFVWIAANGTELPWQELNHRTGRIEERRLAPDAIVELPAERTRVFLEDEMGIAALPRRDESAQAWALSRLNRYASFVLQGSHLTFYAQKYPDGWKPSSSFSSIPTSAPQTSVRSSGNGERSTAPLRWSYARSAPGRRQPCSAAAFTWPILIRRSRSSEVS